MIANYLFWFLSVFLGATRILRQCGGQSLLTFVFSPRSFLGEFSPVDPFCVYIPSFWFPCWWCWMQNRIEFFFWWWLCLKPILVCICLSGVVFTCWWWFCERLWRTPRFFSSMLVVILNSFDFGFVEVLFARGILFF